MGLVKSGGDLGLKRGDLDADDAKCIITMYIYIYILCVDIISGSIVSNNMIIINMIN